MQIFILFSAFSVALLSLSTQAAVLEDPSGHLSMIDSMKKKSAFTDRFKIGDKAVVRVFHKDCQIGCDPVMGCWSACTEVMEDFTKELAVCSATDATAVFSDGTQEQFIAADLAAYSDNSLRKELTELDVYVGMSGKVVIDTMAQKDFLLADGTKVPAFEVMGRFVAKDGEFAVEYVLGQDVAGMVEILYKRINGTKIYKVKAITR